ncbi:MAG: hypothetical protein JG776_1132 [Caloramator sp.]|jgi:hypothetical protein|uniref:Uncharacterized protein n=1 Tax=Caloramator proteoclasticus DSM 10124 TaxID=1121262 RepID=A0A1M5B640_9CLOT|nr:MULTISPECIES: hypothetical protein [Caloramator]MBZ4663430.1 hypothetical protein [Caloramator sp.]SHF37747.1 hypothetical protein SAMN02746091_02382 [Caloramator proteoclasticus DSM 10124]
MNRRTIKIFVILIISLLVLLIVQFKPLLNYINNIIIYKETRINLYNKKTIFKATSPASFHGDGIDYYVFQLEKADVDLILSDKIKKSKWNRLPIDKDIYTVIDKQLTYDIELTNLLKNTSYSPIPNVKNGYYLFLYKNYTKDYYFNFKLYILDADNLLLYLIKYDS